MEPAHHFDERHALDADLLESNLRREMRDAGHRSEEHTSELQSQSNLVCRLLLEKKKALHASRLELNDVPVGDAAEAASDYGSHDARFDLGGGQRLTKEERRVSRGSDQTRGYARR